MDWIDIDLDPDGKAASNDSWLVQPWGSPVGLIVLPLFREMNGYIERIGSAVEVGGSEFCLSALHCFTDGLIDRFGRPLDLGEQRSGSIDNENCSYFVVRCYPYGDGTANVRPAKCKYVSAVHPTDVVGIAPEFEPGLRTLDQIMTFGIPERGDKVWSIGYTKPEGLEDQKFDVHDFTNAVSRGAYKHELEVSQGEILDVFTDDFIPSFGRGPCFTFTGELRSGKSGGAIIHQRSNRIIGINSASATAFYDRPMSIGAFLHPIISAPFRLDVDRATGVCPTDGYTCTGGEMMTNGFLHADDSLFEVPLVEMNGHMLPLIDVPVPNTHVYKDFSHRQQGKLSPPLVGEFVYILSAGSSPLRS